MEGLILGGAYIRWEFCVTKTSGLASSSKVNFKKICVTVSFLPCFILYLGAISKYKPAGAYVRMGDLTEGFLRYYFGGLIFGGSYTWRGLFYGIALLFLNFIKVSNKAYLVSECIFSCNEMYVLLTRNGVTFSA